MIAHFAFIKDAAIITPNVANETGTAPIGKVMIENRHRTAENIAVNVISLIFIISLDLNTNFARRLFYYFSVIGFEYDCGAVVNIDDGYFFYLIIISYVNLFTDQN